METADEGRSLHPAVLVVFSLLLLVLLSALLQGWLGFPRKVGLLTAIPIIGLAVVHTAQRFFTLLRRARWLLLSMAFIGIWTSPGLAITWLPGATYEGVSASFYELAQLLMTFAMVTLLLGHLSIENLLLGLRTLIAPLVRIGVDPNRIALRLALTLSEVDADSTRQGYESAHFLPGTKNMFVLPYRSFSAQDFSLLALAGALACVAIAYA